jgi:hypothetical protein
MFQATNIEHLASHFQSLSIDVTLHPLTSQLAIEHLTPLAWLKFAIYVYLCCCAIEVNPTCYLICTTCMLTLKDQQSSTKQFHKFLHLEY